MIAILAEKQVKGRRMMNKRRELAIITVIAILISFETYSLAVVHMAVDLHRTLTDGK